MNRLQSFRMKVKEVLTILPVALLLGLGVVGTLAPEHAYAASSSVPDYIPTEGVKFWVTYLSNNNLSYSSSDLELKLVVAARRSATVTLTYTKTSTTESFTIDANSKKEVTISKTDVYNTAAGTSDLSLLITSTDTISVYAGVLGGQFYESSFVLPEHALGTEYVIQNNRRNLNAGHRSEFAVVATHNGTKVHVTKREYKESNPRSETVSPEQTITLNQGQVYFVKSSANNKNLSGTSIYSEDYPIAVFQADEATMSPYLGGYTQNYQMEQAVPLSSWGMEFIVPRAKYQDYGVIRLTTIYAGTNVKIVDGNGTTTDTTFTNAFATLEYPRITGLQDLLDAKNKIGDLYIKASAPIGISSYLINKALNTSEYEDGIGAPSVAWMLPLRQGVKNMTFATTSSSTDVHFANVVVKTSGVGNMQLDGGSLPAATTIKSVNGTPYSIAQVPVSDGKHQLSNSTTPFIVEAYGLGEDNAFYYATGFNNVPASPVVMIDNQEVTYEPDKDYAEFSYCNKHPGIQFSAIVDYPHTGVKWDLGEPGAISTDPTPTHQYALNVSGADVTHDVKFYVYHQSPLAGVKDTDSVWVKLTVHPAYYDTLKTKVAAKHLEYIWNKSSNPAFGIAGKGELSVGPVVCGKDASNTNNKWTKADKPEVTSIFDSLVYKTMTWNCDSIFYLELDVVPDIIKTAENRTICQHDALAWTGHAAGEGHRLSRENKTTHEKIYSKDGGGSAADMYKTDVVGTFEIRDTLVSKVFPYPDSIHILNLTVNVKPAITLTEPAAICQTYDDVLNVEYTTSDADRFTYSLKNSSNVEVKGGTKTSPGASGTLTISGMGSLPNGSYTLYATAYSVNPANCPSVEQSVTVTINIKPELSSLSMAADNDQKCYPAASFDVKYEHANSPTKIFYKVSRGSTALINWGSGEADVNTDKKFTITTTPKETWIAGTYTVEAYVQTAEGCHSDTSTTSFKILTQPTLTITSIADACDADGTAELKFTTANATTYNYYIIDKATSAKKTSLKDPAVNVADGDHTIDLDISALNVDDAARTFTLKMVANSSDCHSDTATVDFVVYPMPKATINSDPVTELNACAPYKEKDNLTVSYSTTNATQVKWELEQPSGSKVTHDYAAVGTSFSIPKAQLEAPGDYTLTITGLKSANGCVTENAASVTFTMFNPAKITLEDISAVCAGNAVTSKYTAEYTDSYTYEVKTKDGSKLKGSGSSTTINGEIDLSKTDTLPAGTYVLSVTATNANNCGSSTAEKEFTINPIPVINSLSTPANVCATEVTSRDVEFTATDAANILYTLKKGEAVWNAENSVAVSAGKFSIRTDTLSAGNYKVEAKPVSGAGCTGSVKTVSFDVYPHPTVTLPAKLPSVCFDEDKITITYSSTDAKTYAYTLADKDGNPLTPGNGTAVASGSIDVPLTATMTAAKSPYKFSIEVTSDKECKSGKVERTFTINPKPTAGITSVESKCDNEDKAKVVYTASDADQYRYQIGTGSWSGWKTIESKKEFDLDISGLSDGNYTLTLQTRMESTECVSDPTEAKPFTIYKLPVVGVSEIKDICKGDDATATCTAATTASSVTYTLKLGGTAVPEHENLSSEVKDGKFTIKASDLGDENDVKTYTVDVTPHSAAPESCTGTPVTGLSFKVNPLPKITTLGTISSDCETRTEPLTTNITVPAGCTYKYEVLKKSGSDYVSMSPAQKKEDQTATTISLNVSGWGYGDYKLVVQAVSAAGCPSEATDGERTFTLWKQPVVDKLTDVKEVCEQTETSVSYDFEMTGAVSYTYRVDDGSKISGNGDVPASGKGTITFDPHSLTASAPSTDHTLYVIAKSDKDCESAPKTAKLTVNNMPSLTIDAITANPNQCSPVTKFVVSYTPVDAARILWKVDEKYADYQLHNIPNPGFGDYEFEIPTSTWAPGTYTLRAFPQSSINCDSAEVVTTFTINPTPTIKDKDFTINSLCKQDEVTVTFKHTNGNSVKYWFEDNVERTATISGTADNASFAANISSLAAGDHTIRMQVVSDKGCTSEVTADKSFTIYPIPTLDAIDTAAIYPITSIDVRYTAANVVDGTTKGTYTYTLTGGNIPSGTPRTGNGVATDGGMIPVNTDGLKVAEYTLSVTVTSAHGCTKTDNATITIYDPTDVTIDEPISVDLCKGSATPITVSIHTTYANKYTYVVTNTNGDEKATGWDTYESDGANPVDKSFSLDISSWAADVYTVTVTAENTLTSASKKSSASFEIYAIPVLTFNEHAPICEGAETTVEITHSTENIESVEYKVEKDGSDYAAATWTAAAGKIILNVGEWENATYTIYGKPTSSHGCVGEWAHIDLVVNNQPEATITSMPTDICAGEGYLNVEFSDGTGDARTYAFSILNADDSPVSGYASGGNITTPGSGTYAVAVDKLPVGSYKMKLTTKTEAGCSSVQAVKAFSVRDTFLNVTKATICESQTYTWKYGGHSEEIKGSDHFHTPVKADTIDRNFPTAFGCDSIYRLILTVEEEFVFITDTTICYGEKFNWTVKDKCSGETIELMRGLTATTYQVDTLPCGDLWCAPVYILDLKVREEYAAETEYYTLSENEILTWRGQSITEAGTYEDRKSQPVAGPTHGCDSVYRIIVDKPKVERKVSNQDVCYGETVYFNKKQFTNLPVGQSVLLDTLRSTTGYDSVYLRLNLTVGPRYYDSVSVSACDHYVWPVNGNTYMHSGIYREELASVDGCDSIFVLNLTMNKEYEYYETYDITAEQLPYTVHDYTYTAAGDYDRVFTAQGGCDSIYHITISVHETLYPTDTVIRTACTNELPYSWRGGEYYHTGIYSVTTHTPDEIHVLNLTVNDAYSDTTYVHACSSYTWPVNGETYTASTIVPIDKKTTLDCDSTVVLKLTIGKPTTATVEVNACQYEMTTVGNRTFVPTGLTYPDFSRTLRNSSGCDSTVTYKVTVIPRIYKPETEYGDYCEGTEYTWRGHTYTKAGTYYDSVPDANGCTKDVYTLKLTAKPSYWIDEDVEVWEDYLPYVWTGHKSDTLLRTNGDYYDYLTSKVSGCDSIHHIHFHVNWVERHYDAPLEGCESVTWRGKPYTESALVSDTAFTDNAHTKYTDIYFCEITVNHPVEQVEPDYTICQNEEFTWHKQSYEANHFEPGDYPLTAKVNCDTIYTTTLHVKQTYYVNEAMDVCATDLPIEWHGQLLTKDDISGDKIKATDSRPAPNGCDTIYNVTITVGSVTAPQASTAASICVGKTYKWMKDGKLLMTIPGNVAGKHTYYYWYTVPGECDSTYLSLDLTVNDPDVPTQVNVAICHGEKFDWIVPGCNPGDPDVTLMKGLTESTHQFYTLPCEGDGCSPTYELNLTVYPEYAHVDDPVHLCAGETLKWRGQTITKAGTYEDRVSKPEDDPNTHGCDSIYRITVTKREPEQKSSSMTVCYGKDVVFNEHTYTGLEVGNHTLKETIQSVVDGCDSLYLTLNLTVEPYSYDSAVATACDSYTWSIADGGDGRICTESGIYRIEDKTSSGCGSVSVLNLTINKSYSFNEAYTVLSTEMPFTVHGYEFTAAGSHDCAFTAVGGCDSIYHVTLTVQQVPLPKDTTYDAICEGETYTWGDKECTETGWYIYTENDGTKDVAIHVLYLTANKKYSHTTPVKLCGETSYKWDVDGKTYTTSGKYTWKGHSIAGCDSIEILDLKLGQPNTGAETVTVCHNEQVTIGNHSFVATENTSFTETLTNASGCDSVITYTVIVTKPTFTAVEKPDDYCEGATYTWRGHTYETAGTYFDTTFNGGCAAEIHTLELVGHTSYYFEQGEVEVWEKALPYAWTGHIDHTTLQDTLLYTNGDYYDRNTTVNGCDSTYHIHFHVNFVTRDTVYPKECDSYTWEVNNNTYTFTETGLYSDTVFVDAEHTDYSVIHFCDVTIFPSYDVDSTLTKHICKAQQPFEWYGEQYSVPQDDAHKVNDHMFVATFEHTELTVNDCDSLAAILTLYLHLPSETTVEEETSVCDSYNWDGLIVTQSGKYEHKYDNYGLGGCADSVVYRNFTVYNSETEHLVIDECDGYYWERNQEYITKSGYYEKSIPQLGGLCDKIYTLDLTIRERERDTTKISTCKDKDGFTWAISGLTYYNTTVDSVVIDGGASNGCKRVRYLFLEMKDSVVVPVQANEEIITCEQSYNWNGVDYTESTIARYQTTSAVTGCDSIIYQRITFRQKSPEQTIQITACREYQFDDDKNGIHVHFTESNPDYVLNLTNVDGCDSIVHLNVTITKPDTIEHTFQACESLTWNEQTFTSSGDFYQDFAMHDDCSQDSVIWLHLTIDHSVTKDDYVTRWDSYVWEGDTYTESGNYTKTLTTSCGCDSIVTLHLTINDSQSDEEWQIACDEFPWEWSGLTYTETGDYEVTKTIDAGTQDQRDSTRTLHLGIGHEKHIVTEEQTCDEFVWRVQGATYTFTESGTYWHQYKDTCEGNVDTLHLTIFKTPVPVEYYDTACDVLTINGKSYFESTEFSETLQTINGCDSVVNYHITIYRRTPETVDEQKACDSYTWEGTTYTTSGTYTKVLTNIHGCDSVVTLKLSIFPSYNYETDAVGCNGNYIWGDEILTAAGDHTKQFTSVSGCDSIVTLHLSLPATVESEPLIAEACEEYEWNGKTYTESGSHTQTFTSVTGCDSIARLNLNITGPRTGEMTETAETSFTWGSDTYYESGDYEKRFPQTEGCDSVATLHLTITEPLPISTELKDTACDAYTWDKETFYKSGVYVRNFPTIDERDSIVKLTLTIVHDTAVSETRTECESYTWEGDTYTESGVYTKVLQREPTGCDSIVTLNLTIGKHFNTESSITAYGVYTWGGKTYSESGTYTQTFTSQQQGCENDSTVTLTLIIIDSETSAFDAEECTEYAWADSIYTHSTVHSEVFTSTKGSDSIVTMTLIINEPVYTELYDTVKEPDCSDPLYGGYTLPWAGGETVHRAGIYTTTLQSGIGCDSIVTLYLNWCDQEPCIADTSYQTLSACDSVQFESRWYKTTGSYPLHYTTDAGCDSVHMLRVEIKPVARHLIDTTACDSLFWPAKNKWYYETGYDYDTLTGANGCDSVAILHVVIGHAGEGSIDLESCDAYTLNGETFTESGTYVQHLLTTTGCDSTLTINLTINPRMDTLINQEACDTLFWEGDTLTVTGFYPMVLTSEITGCDSVVDMHLIVYGSKEVAYIDSIHCDSIVWGDDYAGIDTLRIDGIYTKTFQSTVGCDSTVTMDLRLKHKIEIAAEDTSACDSLVWNEKVYFESGTYSDTTQSFITGCDSITTMKVTINPTLFVEIEDSVPPPFYLWPTELDTIWESGDYVDTVPSLVTGCDSITTLHLIMTDSIILDPQEPVRIDTFGYCPGDTMNFIYNLLKGHPTKYILIFDTVAVEVPDYTRQFKSVLDTTELANHGQDSLFTVVIPPYCPPAVYCAHLQLFDDFSCSDVYDFCINVNVKGAIVKMWTDVAAINNHDLEYISYQWYYAKLDSTAQAPRPLEIVEGATKQYYYDYIGGEDLYGWYRAKLQRTDSTWVYTCDQFFDERTDSLELIAYPTPAPVGQPVTLKAMGIMLEKLVGSTLTITKESGLKMEEYTFTEGQRSVEVNLSSGLYIATLVTGNADDKGVRTANVKFVVF